MIEKIRENALMIFIGVVVVIVLIGAFLAYRAASEKFKAECDDLGGRVDSETTTSQTYGTYTGPNGKTMTGNHTTTSTVTRCLGPNGEVLATQ